MLSISQVGEDRMMEYITVKDASEKWNISTRRVCVLCKSGRIKGAIKKSKVWMIPVDAKKPEDGRIFDTHYEINPSVLLFNPDYVLGEGNIELTKKDKAICEVQNRFYSGQLEEAYLSIGALLDIEEDKRYIYLLNVLKMAFSADLGKKDDYNSALKKVLTISEEMTFSETEKYIGDLYFCSERYPKDEVFSCDEYKELMPLLSLLVAKRVLNENIQSGTLINVTNFEIICKEIESKNCMLICAYYHLYLAVYLNALGKENLYNYHINKALEILLPRGWYTPLAEYSATLDLSFIKNINAKAYRTIEMLSKKIINNFVEMGIFDELFSTPKMDRNINVQVALKIAQGKNNEEIAKEMGISVYKVRQHINDICDMIGSDARKDIKASVLRNFML